jgi:hypothetical protein
MSCAWGLVERQAGLDEALGLRLVPTPDTLPLILINWEAKALDHKRFSNRDTTVGSSILVSHIACVMIAALLLPVIDHFLVAA